MQIIKDHQVIMVCFVKVVLFLLLNMLLLQLMLDRILLMEQQLPI